MTILPATPTIFFGAYDSTEWQRSLNGLASIAAANALFGKKASASTPQYSWAWGLNADGSPKYQRFYAPRHDADRVAGRITVITWMQHNGAVRTDPSQVLLFNNEAVLSGKHDAYINQFGLDVGTWMQANPKARLIIRLNPEMNGWWEGPFSEYDKSGALANGNTAGSFARAWRYTVDRVRKLAPNVEWFWCANPVDRAGVASPTAADKLGTFYPGDDYVDWSGIDLYNKAGAVSSWRSFQQCLEGVPGGWPANTMEAVLRVSADKPWIIGEWGCSPVGGDKPAWIKEMLRLIPQRYSFIKGLLSFNVMYANDLPQNDWRITADPLVSSAFAEGIAAPQYMEAGQFPLDAPRWTDYSSVDESSLLSQLADFQEQLQDAQQNSNALQMLLDQASSQLVDVKAERERLALQISNLRAHWQQLVAGLG